MKKKLAKQGEKMVAAKEGQQQTPQEWQKVGQNGEKTPTPSSPAVDKFILKKTGATFVIPPPSMTRTTPATGSGDRLEEDGAAEKEEPRKKQPPMAVVVEPFPSSARDSLLQKLVPEAVVPTSTTTTPLPPRPSSGDAPRGYYFLEQLTY